MKHLFIINPTAGKKNSTQEILKKANDCFTEDSFDYYITRGTHDATEYVKMYLEKHLEPTRIYACGGDGTLNEVVTGAYDFPNVEIACYPSGSGNDFIKAFGEANDFLALERMKDGKAIDVDVLKLNGRLSINICNLGFDALVGFKFAKFKKWPLVSGKGAYNLAVLSSLFKKMGYPLQVRLDGVPVFKGNALLCAIANGICYGGGYYCAPDARVDDGLANVCIVSKVSRLTFIRLIKQYKLGKHIHNPKLEKIIQYKQAKKIEIDSTIPFYYTLDGEMMQASSLSVEVAPKKVRFVLPPTIIAQKPYLG